VAGRPRSLLHFVLAGLAAFVLAVCAACGGSEQGSDLKGVAWHWSAVREGEGSVGLFPILEPENYLLRLDDDGTFIGRADCKAIAGTYSLSGSELTLDLRPTTKRRCSKGSHAQRYIDLLGRVATYEIYDKGALALGLANNAGHMYFSTSAASLP